MLRKCKMGMGGVRVNITVVGAGAVGGYFGGRLQEAGLNVTFLVREKRARQLAETGLVIHSPHGNAHLRPHLVLRPEDIATCDVILLSVKNYHLDGVIPLLHPLVNNGAKVLPLQNGVEHYRRLAEEFGEDVVLGGLCNIIVTLDDVGRVVHSSKSHFLTYGARTPQQTEFCAKLALAVEHVNSKWIYSNDIWADIWNKFMLITAFSGVTTASRLSMDQIAKSPATLEVLQTALREMWTIANHHGVSLPESSIQRTIEQMSKQPPGSTSSMHQDLRKGLELEVESLQGAALRLAEEVGVSTPVIRTLYGLMKPFEFPTHNL